MKFTALVHEVVTRDIRLVIDAKDKTEARQRITAIAAHSSRYKEGFVTSRKLDVSPVLDSLEPWHAASIARFQQELRR